TASDIPDILYIKTIFNTVNKRKPNNKKRNEDVNGELIFTTRIFNIPPLARTFFAFAHNTKFHQYDYERRHEYHEVY
ncbi:TPA: hypothetical protein ACIVFB_004769, partial [Salmonella enterica subsp. enterica serovar Birkenhead]